LFALVLGVTALVISIAPAPRGEDPPVTPTPAPSRTAVEDASLTFRAPAAKRGPPRRRVAPGTHLTVSVAATRPGQAEIPRLGLTTAVTVHAPARFDLLAPDGGRYDVLFTPAAGEPARVGTLVSRPPRR
jgi:hypothetical protein